MIALKNLHMSTFLTTGTSLHTWSGIGLFDRELAQHRALRPHLRRLTLVSYGDRRDLDYREELGDVDLFCNRWGVHRRLYRTLLPWIYPLGLRGPAVVRSTQVQGAELALRVARFRHLPFIARCGYLYSDFVARQRGPDSAKARTVHRLEGRVFRSADRVVVTTDAMRDTAVYDHGVAESRVRVIPNYVQTDLFRPDPASTANSQRICFVGRLAPQKNISALLEAATGLDVELVIIGSGPLEAALKEQAKTLGLTVRFMGNVPHRELPDVMNSCGMFVLPSHYEGHPKTLIEAMACEMPVIGADSPGIREIVRDGDNGALCGTGPDQLREAIERVMTGEDLRRRLGPAARKYVVDNFSLERVVDLELAMLEELINEKYGKGKTAAGVRGTERDA